MSGGKGTGKRTGRSDRQNREFPSTGCQSARARRRSRGCRSGLTPAILQGPVIFTAHTGRPLDLRLE
ncbi:hypothetical protein ECDEC8E_2039 [Escherichia coli DEC8E]|nr:hypothetical protein ECDEC8E_2039 [Escherichia coli DEC8E]